MNGDPAAVDLVVGSLEPWDQVWRRNQYLVAALLRAGAVRRALFVEPPADPTNDVAARRRPRLGAGLRAEPSGIAPGRLWLYQPTKPLPRRFDPGFDGRRARAVLRAGRRAGLAHPVLWVNDPALAALLDTGAGPVLYDVTDDWLAATLPARGLERARADEAALLRRAAVVTVCSPHLAQIKGAGRPVTLVTNGVDLDRYRRTAPRPADLPAAPVALYAGTLHADRLDVALTARTARALRGVARLVLLGPDALEAPDRETLQAAGVVLLGARPYEEVPAYLQHADALVVPHVVSPFTESLDPLKLYEYLAVGRPVVSTP
ncbi:MAG TPA: glycosyltransferase, partial [Cellulomonas sp.]